MRMLEKLILTPDQLNLRDRFNSLPYRPDSLPGILAKWERSFVTALCLIVCDIVIGYLDMYLYVLRGDVVSLVLGTFCIGCGFWLSLQLTRTNRLRRAVYQDLLDKEKQHNVDVPRQIFFAAFMFDAAVMLGASPTDLSQPFTPLTPDESASSSHQPTGLSQESH